MVEAAMTEVILAALNDLKPAKNFSWHRAATVRRQSPRADRQGSRQPRYPSGPVDHAVPVLRVDGLDGKLRAVLFGYACHNTTMQFYEWCGDYAGFAQAYLEERHPAPRRCSGSAAAATPTPSPASKIELCKKYGETLPTPLMLCSPSRRVKYGNLPGTLCDHPGAPGRAAEQGGKSRPTPEQVTRRPPPRPHVAQDTREGRQARRSLSRLSGAGLAARQSGSLGALAARSWSTTRCA